MRKLLFLSFTIVLGLSIPVDSLHAQTSKKEIRELLKSLQNEKEINVIFDISNAMIEGQSEADFIDREVILYGDGWIELWENEYKPSIYDEFLSEFISLMYEFGYNVRFGNFENAKYQIRLDVNNIKVSGHATINANIEERKTERVLYDFTVKGRGGQYGTKVNLIGDGFRRAGKKMAIRMNKIFICGKAISFWH